MRRAPGLPGDAQPTSQPGPAQTAQSQTAQPPSPQQTFAQMQANGMARPAPPPMRAPQQVQQFAPSQNQQGVQGQLQQSVSEALARGGSRYALPQVQQVRSALQGDLEQQFGAQRRQLDEEMARRGIGASSIAGGYHGDLMGQQSRAMANLDAQLVQDAARTNQQDLSAALAAGQTFDQSLFNRDLSGFGANMQATGANNAANMSRDQFNQGQYQNAAQLALAGASGQEGSRQFDLQQELSRTLGLGGLGLQERALTQEGQQFDRTFGLSQEIQRGSMTLQQAQQALNERVQTGQLSLAQANQALAELQNTQQYGLDTQRFGESQRQFNAQQALANRSQNLAELSNSQQYGLQRAELTGQYEMGNPSLPSNYDPQNGAHSTALSYFQQYLGRNPTPQEFQEALQRTQGLGAHSPSSEWDSRLGSWVSQQPRAVTGQTQNASQFQQQLAQQLGLAQMGDRTANRGIDANAALAQNDLYLRIAQMLAGMGWPTGATPSTGTPGTTPAPSGTNPAGPGGSQVPPPGSGSGSGPGIEPVPREGELARMLQSLFASR